MKFQSKITLILVGVVLSGLFLKSDLAYGKKAEKEETCAPNIDWNKWDEATLLKSFEDGTIDPSFRQFFDRDPQRDIPRQKKIIVAPADGKIMKVERENDHIVIRIHISLWDVHIQRFPMAGKVLSIERKPGKFLSTRDINHVTENFRVITTLQTEIGIVTVTQIAGINANRIQSFVKEGANVALGDKLGRIQLGSTAILTLPKNVKLEINKSQKIFAGTTILASYD